MFILRVITFDRTLYLYLVIGHVFSDRDCFKGNDYISIRGGVGLLFFFLPKTNSVKEFQRRIIIDLKEAHIKKNLKISKGQ